MTKQVKIGFDKTFSPKERIFAPLYDIATAEKLKDLSDNDIVTEVIETSTKLLKANKSLSVSLNKNKVGNNIVPVPLVENFPNSSAVSTTLLGVERTEVQLSLFSDVSTYGLDRSNWEFYTFNRGQSKYPTEWYERRHPYFGKRKEPRLIEGTEEQALYIEAFPVNYTFPYGKSWEDLGRYNQTLFLQYLRFVAIGRILYEFYKANGFEIYARNNFLSENISLINYNTGNEITVLPTDSINNFVSVDIDVIYKGNLEETFAEIEQFTLNFLKLRNESFNFLFDSSISNDLEVIQNDISQEIQNAIPGYRSTNSYYGLLQSKQTFRYQPGRISGFTFGLRVNSDLNSTANVIEWGCENESDSYVFQIRGTEFNIVRRSVIPLGSKNLDRLNLPLDSENLIRKSGLNNQDQLYETVITRDKFNGDPLNGNGPSGYILSYKDVTMYKIEFGWYGAIGAKFYAYIPVGNNKARWVLLHTLVIENSLEEPSLKNPNFRFKYSLDISDTSNILEPLYVYKYGASYYIDGGDEGTLKINSYTSDEKIFNFDTSLIGMLPKNELQNSNKGVVEKVPNRKEAYPSLVSLTANNFCEVSLYEIQGSPYGQHFHYAPSLHNGKNPESKEITLQLSGNGEEFVFSGSEIDNEDKGKKIVANGIYNAYVTENENDILLNSFTIQRRKDYEKRNQRLINKLRFADGSREENAYGKDFDVRVTGYDTIVASNIPIVENEFRIHFLNPVKKDDETSFHHFAEFTIGVTPYKPMYSSANTDALVFEDLSSNEVELNMYSNNVIRAEWCHLEHNFDLEGFERTEWDPSRGIRFDLDYRLPRPSGEDSGSISALKGKVETLQYELISVEQLGPGNYKLFLDGFVTGVVEGESEIGINEQASGFIITNVGIENVNNVDRQFIEVLHGSGNNLGLTNGDFIQLKLISIEDDHKLEFIDEEGESRFERKEFLSSKILSFNAQPLYVVVGLMDYAEINNIIIEEIGEETRVYTPNWLVDANKSDVIVNSGGSSSSNPSSNFKEGERLDSLIVDTQNGQPLRPGQRIASFFVAPNKTKKVDLTNIFSYNKRKLTKGTLNNKALFLSAKPIGSEGAGAIQSTITVKEN